jgi:hypothetical protein
MSPAKKRIDPVLPDQGGRLTADDPLGTNMSKEEEIRVRAYELYERRGREHGHADEDWVRAEREICS